MFQYLFRVEGSGECGPVSVTELLIHSPLAGQGTSETRGTDLFSALHSLPCFCAFSPLFFLAHLLLFKKNVERGPTIYHALILILSWRSREGLFMMIKESQLVWRKRGAVATRGPLSPGNFLHSSDTLPSLNTQYSCLLVSIIL